MTRTRAKPAGSRVGGSRGARDRLLGRLARGLPFAWLGLFFVVPFVVTLKLSLSSPALSQPPYTPVLDWEAGLAGLSEFLNALDFSNYETLVSDDLYWRAALTSLAMAGVATALLALVGYPLAYAMAKASPRWRPVLVALVVVPFWTSFLIRVYAWIAILKPEGLLNRLLLALGLIAEPATILDTPWGILLGLVYAYLPFMVLPLYAVLERRAPELDEAARDLGASPLKSFWTITFPLSRPGLVAGALLCFIPIVGEFIVPDLLGGSDTLMLGRVLWTEFFSNRDWPLASAVAVLMLVLVAVPVALLREAETRRAEGAS
jgi:putrescine transport system permease protein